MSWLVNKASFAFTIAIPEYLSNGEVSNVTIIVIGIVALVVFES